MSFILFEKLRFSIYIIGEKQKNTRGGNAKVLWLVYDFRTGCDGSSFQYGMCPETCSRQIADPIQWEYVGQS